MVGRDYQELFSSELHEAIKLLGTLPRAGTPYAKTPVPGVRRMYIRTLGCHLYYTFNETEVVVRAFWPARRERGPHLR